ncbi:MAG: LysM domain-containing protein [Solirubrobacterales bacterium]
MTQRSSSPARALAAIALVCGFLVLVVVIAGSFGGGDDSSNEKGSSPGQVTRKGSTGGDDAPVFYVVQNGDTLTSIAHEMGVSVSQIQALNPGVDPQILVSGEKLKLR